MFQVIAATGAAVATIAVAVLDIACSWPAGGTSAGVRPMSGTINPTVTVALRSLEATEADLQRTVTEAATGRAVATVEDNPAVYVIAQRLAMQSGEVRDQVRRRHAVRPNVERRREQRRLGGFRTEPAPGSAAAGHHVAWLSDPNHHHGGVDHDRSWPGVTSASAIHEATSLSGSSFTTT